MKGRVLVAGFATRHVAQSAFRADYEVCAVDHFCDQDLSWYTSDREKFEDLADLPDAIDRIAGRHAFDFLVVTSGAEDMPTVLPLCGTPRGRITRFLDKLDIQHFFESLPVPAPRLLANGEFPVMVKPRRGAGGWRNAVIHDPTALADWETLYPSVPYIRQELVSGIPASVSCIADGSRAVAIAANEQLLRGTGPSAFGFSGSITPFCHPLAGRMIAAAEQIAAESGCIGSVGIDFVVSDSAYWAIEVNPRFQGTVDTVETACGCNLFQYHTEACAGNIPPARPVPRQFAARSILFADRDLTVRVDLKKFRPFVADIPWPDTFFEEEQALVSVCGRGETREKALSILDKHITTVRQYMR